MTSSGRTRYSLPEAVSLSRTQVLANRSYGHPCEPSFFSSIDDGEHKANTRKKATKQVIYRYGDKRKNNPHVGMVATVSDGVEGQTAWACDPHIDLTLNFDSARAGIERLIDDAPASDDAPVMREALERIKRLHAPYLNLIASDSLLAMNSLLHKESMAGQVQMIYIDPPYGIRCGSNFQPFTNKRDVADSDRDEDFTNEPETTAASKASK